MSLILSEREKNQNKNEFKINYVKSKFYIKELS